MISNGAQEILKKMVLAEADDELENAEILCDEGQCWLGYWRTTRKVVDELLCSCLIRDVSDTKGAERYVLNEDGRKAALDRSYINPALKAALAERPALPQSADHEP